MNWLVVIVIFYVAFNIVWGYKKGIVDMIYSLTTWILTLILAVAISPFFANAIIDYTPIDKFLTDSARGKLSDVISEANISEGNTKLLESLGVNIPKDLVDTLSSNKKVLGSIMDNSGVYDVLAKQLAEYAVIGMAFVILLIIFRVIARLIGRKLKAINHVPVVGATNMWVGAAAGFGKAMLVVWAVFAIVALDSTGVFFSPIVKDIYKSPFLLFLYDNNMLIPAIMYFAE